MVEAVTFDFWNTLYGEPEGRTVLDLRLLLVGQVLQRAGIQSDDDRLTSVFHAAWNEAWHRQRFYGFDIGPYGQVRLMAQQLGITSEAIIEDIYEAYSTVLLVHPPSVNDGVADALAALQGRVKMAVICNTGASPGTVLRKVLCQDGLMEYFDHLTFSDEVRVAKPNPQIFYDTLQHLGVKVDHALHVGDDDITDIVGAKRSGMKAVWIYPRADWALPECDFHIHNMRELPDLIADLNR